MLERFLLVGQVMLSNHIKISNLRYSNAFHTFGKHARLLTAMVKIMKNLLFYSIKWLLWGWYKSYMNLKITREGLLAKYPWIEQMYHDIKSARARQKFRLVLPICCFRKSSFFFLINAYDQSFVKFLWSEICFFVTFISILQETRLKWHYERRHESLLRGEKNR